MPLLNLQRKMHRPRQIHHLLSVCTVYHGARASHEQGDVPLAIGRRPGQLDFCGWSLRN